MRYDCEFFPGVYVEFSEAWTRGELKKATDTATTIAELWRLSVGKITACYIARIDDTPITDSADLSRDYDDAMYDTVDMRLFRWLSGVMFKAAIDATTLGETVAASLWTTTVTAVTAADNQQTQ